MTNIALLIHIAKPQRKVSSFPLHIEYTTLTNRGIIIFQSTKEGTLSPDFSALISFACSCLKPQQNKFKRTSNINIWTGVLFQRQNFEEYVHTQVM